VPLVLSLLAISAAKAGPVEIMSFWDGNPEDMKGWTNTAFTDSASDLAGYHAANIQVLWKVEGDFFTGSPRALRSDWQAAWNSTLAFAQPAFANGTIVGFFLGDENVWNGLPPASLDVAAQAVRAAFPSAIIWTNEAIFPVIDGSDRFGTKHNYTHLSTGLTHFSVDFYHMSSGEFVDDVRQLYQKAVYPKMAKGQKALLVPGSFASTHNPSCNVSCYDTFCARDAYEFYKWAQEDDLVAGIAPWHWTRCGGCVQYQDEIGTQSLNVTKAAWQAIGRDIISKLDAGRRGRIAENRPNFL